MKEWALTFECHELFIHTKYPRIMSRYGFKEQEEPKHGYGVLMARFNKYIAGTLIVLACLFTAGPAYAFVATITGAIMGVVSVLVGGGAITVGTIVAGALIGACGEHGRMGNLKGVRPGYAVGGV